MSEDGQLLNLGDALSVGAQQQMNAEPVVDSPALPRQTNECWSPLDIHSSPSRREREAGDPPSVPIVAETDAQTGEGCGDSDSSCLFDRDRDDIIFQSSRQPSSPAPARNFDDSRATPPGPADASSRLLSPAQPRTAILRSMPRSVRGGGLQSVSITNVLLAPCPHCSRGFLPSKIKQHEQMCTAKLGVSGGGGSLKANSTGETEHSARPVEGSADVLVLDGEGRSVSAASASLSRSLSVSGQNPLLSVSRDAAAAALKRSASAAEVEDTVQREREVADFHGLLDTGLTDQQLQRQSAERGGGSAEGGGLWVFSHEGGSEAGMEADPSAVLVEREVGEEENVQGGANRHCMGQTETDEGLSETGSKTQQEEEASEQPERGPPNSLLGESSSQHDFPCTSLPPEPPLSVDDSLAQSAPHSPRRPRDALSPPFHGQYSHLDREQGEDRVSVSASVGVSEVAVHRGPLEETPQPLNVHLTETGERLGSGSHSTDSYMPNWRLSSLHARLTSRLAHRFSSSDHEPHTGSPHHSASAASASGTQMGDVKEMDREGEGEGREEPCMEREGQRRSACSGGRRRSSNRRSVGSLGSLPPPLSLLPSSTTPDIPSALPIEPPSVTDETGGSGSKSYSQSGEMRLQPLSHESSENACREREGSLQPRISPPSNAPAARDATSTRDESPPPPSAAVPLLGYSGHSSAPAPSENAQHLRITVDESLEQQQQQQLEGRSLEEEKENVRGMNYEEGRVSGSFGGGPLQSQPQPRVSPKGSVVEGLCGVFESGVDHPRVLPPESGMVEPPAGHGMPPSRQQQFTHTLAPVSQTQEGPSNIISPVSPPVLRERDFVAEHAEAQEREKGKGKEEEESRQSPTFPSVTPSAASAGGSRRSNRSRTPSPPSSAGQNNRHREGGTSDATDFRPSRRGKRRGGGGGGGETPSPFPSGQEGGDRGEADGGGDFDLSFSFSKGGNSNAQILVAPQTHGGDGGAGGYHDETAEGLNTERSSVSLFGSSRGPLPPSLMHPPPEASSADSAHDHFNQGGIQESELSAGPLREAYASNSSRVITLPPPGGSTPLPHTHKRDQIRNGAHPASLPRGRVNPTHPDIDHTRSEGAATGPRYQAYPRHAHPPLSSVRGSRSSSVADATPQTAFALRVRSEVQRRMTPSPEGQNQMPPFRRHNSSGSTSETPCSTTGAGTGGRQREREREREGGAGAEADFSVERPRRDLRGLHSKHRSSSSGPADVSQLAKSVEAPPMHGGEATLSGRCRYGHGVEQQPHLSLSEARAVTAFSSYRKGLSSRASPPGLFKDGSRPKPLLTDFHEENEYAGGGGTRGGPRGQYVYMRERAWSLTPTGRGLLGGLLDEGVGERGVMRGDGRTPGSQSVALPLPLPSGVPLPESLDSTEWARSAYWGRGAGRKGERDARPPMHPMQPLGAPLTFTRLQGELAYIENNDRSQTGGGRRERWVSRVNCGGRDVEGGMGMSKFSNSVRDGDHEEDEEQPAFVILSESRAMQQQEELVSLRREGLREWSSCFENPSAFSNGPRGWERGSSRYVGQQPAFAPPQRERLLRRPASVPIRTAKVKVKGDDCGGEEDLSGERGQAGGLGEEEFASGAQAICRFLHSCGAGGGEGGRGREAFSTPPASSSNLPLTPPFRRHMIDDRQILPSAAERKENGQRERETVLLQTPGCVGLVGREGLVASSCQQDVSSQKPSFRGSGREGEGEEQGGGRLLDLAEVAVSDSLEDLRVLSSPSPPYLLQTQPSRHHHHHCISGGGKRTTRETGATELRHTPDLSSLPVECFHTPNVPFRGAREKGDKPSRTAVGGRADGLECEESNEDIESTIDAFVASVRPSSTRSSVMPPPSPLLPSAFNQEQTEKEEPYPTENAKPPSQRRPSLFPFSSDTNMGIPSDACTAWADKESFCHAQSQTRLSGYPQNQKPRPKDSTPHQLPPQPHRGSAEETGISLCRPSDDLERRPRSLLRKAVDVESVRESYRRAKLAWAAQRKRGSSVSHPDSKPPADIDRQRERGMLPKGIIQHSSLSSAASPFRSRNMENTSGGRMSMRKSQTPSSEWSSKAPSNNAKSKGREGVTLTRRKETNRKTQKDMISKGRVPSQNPGGRETEPSSQMFDRLHPPRPELRATLAPPGQSAQAQIAVLSPPHTAQRPATENRSHEDPLGHGGMGRGRENGEHLGRSHSPQSVPARCDGKGNGGAVFEFSNQSLEDHREAASQSPGRDIRIQRVTSESSSPPIRCSLPSTRRWAFPLLSSAHGVAVSGEGGGGFERLLRPSDSSVKADGQGCLRTATAGADLSESRTQQQHLVEASADSHGAMGLLALPPGFVLARSVSGSFSGPASASAQQSTYRYHQRLLSDSLVETTDTVPRPSHGPRETEVGGGLEGGNWLMQQMSHHVTPVLVGQEKQRKKNLGGGTETLLGDRQKREGEGQSGGGGWPLLDPDLIPIRPARRSQFGISSSKKKEREGEEREEGTVQPPQPPSGPSPALAAVRRQRPTERERKREARLLLQVPPREARIAPNELPHAADSSSTFHGEEDSRPLIDVSGVSDAGGWSAQEGESAFEEGQGEATQGDDLSARRLVRCGDCGRKFAPASLRVHRKACRRVFGKSRPRFDMQRRRIAELQLEPCVDYSAWVPCPDCRTLFPDLRTMGNHRIYCKAVVGEREKEKEKETGQAQALSPQKSALKGGGSGSHGPTDVAVHTPEGPLHSSRRKTAAVPASSSGPAQNEAGPVGSARLRLPLPASSSLTSRTRHPSHLSPKSPLGACAPPSSVRRKREEGEREEGLSAERQKRPPEAASRQPADVSARQQQQVEKENHRPERRPDGNAVIAVRPHEKGVVSIAPSNPSTLPVPLSERSHHLPLPDRQRPTSAAPPPREAEPSSAGRLKNALSGAQGSPNLKEQSARGLRRRTDTPPPSSPGSPSSSSAHSRSGRRDLPSPSPSPSLHGERESVDRLQQNQAEKEERRKMEKRHKERQEEREEFHPRERVPLQTLPSDTPRCQTPEGGARVAERGRGRRRACRGAERGLPLSTSRSALVSPTPHAPLPHAPDDADAGAALRVLEGLDERLERMILSGRRSLSGPAEGEGDDQEEREGKTEDTGRTNSASRERPTATSSGKRRMSKATRDGSPPSSHDAAGERRDVSPSSSVPKGRGLNGKQQVSIRGRRRRPLLTRTGDSKEKVERKWGDGYRSEEDEEHADPREGSRGGGGGRRHLLRDTRGFLRGDPSFLFPFQRNAPHASVGRQGGRRQRIPSVGREGGTEGSKKEANLVSPYASMSSSVYPSRFLPSFARGLSSSFSASVSPSPSVSSRAPSVSSVCTEEEGTLKSSVAHDPLVSVGGAERKVHRQPVRDVRGGAGKEKERRGFRSDAADEENLLPPTQHINLREGDGREESVRSPKRNPVPLAFSTVHGHTSSSPLSPPPPRLGPSESSKRTLRQSLSLSLVSEERRFPQVYNASAYTSVPKGSRRRGRGREEETEKGQRETDLPPDRSSKCIDSHSRSRALVRREAERLETAGKVEKTTPLRERTHVDVPPLSSFSPTRKDSTATSVSGVVPRTEAPTGETQVHPRVGGQKEKESDTPPRGQYRDGGSAPPSPLPPSADSSSAHTARRLRTSLDSLDEQKENIRRQIQECTERLKRRRERIRQEREEGS